jgi:hypothetical protein
MHPWADLFRWVTLVLLLVCLVAVPVGIGQVIRPPRTWLLLLGLDLLLVGRIATTFGRMHSAVIWYGAPLTAVATILLTWYSVEAIVQERRRRVEAKTPPGGYERPQ